MRRILLFLLILLSGCQNTNQNHTNSSKNNYKLNNYYKTKSYDKSIYNRYNNKGDRYTIKQDAAPKSGKKIDFKEPVPIKEPISRYGNPSEYNVAGQKYEVMKNPSGYKSRGVASWYATKFHKQRTSSGEPYNMYVMTAAHRTLPLPTYIKVKNLDNGKSAVVKVNDRGPFHGDRLIDLSYAAAVKLGIFPKGTAHVEIETMTGPSGLGSYFLQVGAYNSEAPAKLLKNRLARMIKSPIIIEHIETHFIVRVGPFIDKNGVDSLKSMLAHNGISDTFSVVV